MSVGYSLSHVRRAFGWLGHGEGYSELNGFHPLYRRWREHVEWNVRHESFPVVSYVRSERGVVSFVRKYGRSRMVCLGG